MAPETVHFNLCITVIQVFPGLLHMFRETATAIYIIPLKKPTTSISNLRHCPRQQRKLGYSDILSKL